MKQKIIITLIFFLIGVVLDSPSLYARGFCGGAPIAVGGGGSGRDGLAVVVFLLVSSTSLAVLCKVAEDRDDNNDERDDYTSSNYEFLKEEGAQGQGEHLMVLAKLWGCTDTMATVHFASAIQNNYQRLFDKISHPIVDNFNFKLEQILKNEPFLKNNCSNG